MANKMSMEDRAKQFAPFASLRGYYDLIKTNEKIKEEKKNLSESEAEILSNKLNEIKKGMMITVKYYNKDCYETLTGMVSEFDETYKKIRIVKTYINFDDIVEIEESK